MKKLYIYILALFILIINQNISAQLNLIPNGDFEQGNDVHCSYTYHYWCQNTAAYWNNGIDSTIGIFRCPLWTFDWYDINYSLQNGTQSNGYCQHDRIPTVVLSDRFMGISGNTVGNYPIEGVKCNLLKPLRPSHGYGLEFDLMTVWSAQNKNHQKLLSDSTTLYISFCTDNDKWCKNIAKTLTVTLGPNEINDWHHIKLDFFYPYPPSANNINSLPEWDVIVVYGDYDNPDSYFYIDNMELYDYCDHPCTPEKLNQSISIPEPDQLMNCSSYFLYYGALIDKHFFFIAENATDIYFRVWDRWGWGHSLIEKHIYDPNGLENLPNGLEGYLFEWYGRTFNGNILAQNVYNYEMYVGNCYKRFYYTTSMTVIVDANISLPVIPTYISQPFNTDCCIPHIIINNCYDYLSAYKVSEYIIAHDNYLIPSNGNIVFSAKETVHLKDGFHASEGCFFNANLTGCDAPNKNYFDESLNNDDYYKSMQNNTDTNLFSVNVYPNPTMSKTNIVIDNLIKSTPLNIELFNCYGENVTTIYQSNVTDEKMQFSLNAREFSSGIYYIIVKTKEKNITKKLIIL